jgi:hypothetical protein
MDFAARTDEDTSFGSHHYAFHVSDAEFDAIFERIKKAGLQRSLEPRRRQAQRLKWRRAAASA